MELIPVLPDELWLHIASYSRESYAVIRSLTPLLHRELQWKDCPLPEPTVPLIPPGLRRLEWPVRGVIKELHPLSPSQWARYPPYVGPIFVHSLPIPHGNIKYQTRALYLQGPQGYYPYTFRLHDVKLQVVFPKSSEGRGMLAVILPTPLYQGEKPLNDTAALEAFGKDVRETAGLSSGTFQPLIRAPLPGASYSLRFTLAKDMLLLGRPWRELLTIPPRSANGCATSEPWQRDITFTCSLYYRDNHTCTIWYNLVDVTRN